MKLVISSPCYGGTMFRDFSFALHGAVERARDEGLVTECKILAQRSESLIPRGRNMDGTFFFKSGFDKLLSIDADIDFTYEDFRRIVSSEKDFVGGIYPLKTFPLVANFNPLREHREEFFKTHRGMDWDALRAYAEKYAEPSGEVEVEHVPTGFLCVSRPVFEAAAKLVPRYQTFQSDSGELKSYWEFYPIGVSEGGYLSEDWSFSKIARVNGFKTYINTKVLLGHIGLHTYRMGQFFGEVDRSGK